MSDCEKCGRHDGHWLGCAALLGLSHTWSPEGAQRITDAAMASIMDECGRDGCTSERAISKGPRPAKYCETHKTGSKK